MKGDSPLKIYNTPTVFPNVDNALPRGYTFSELQTYTLNTGLFPAWILDDIKQLWLIFLEYDKVICSAVLFPPSLQLYSKEKYLYILEVYTEIFTEMICYLGIVLK